VATGEVFMGNVGSKEHINFTAIGEVVNLSQRLEAACPPGAVLVSDITYQLIKGKVEASRIDAKGKREEENFAAFVIKREIKGGAQEMVPEPRENNDDSQPR